jgi:hypothetical protein
MANEAKHREESMAVGFSADARSRTTAKVPTKLSLFVTGKITKTVSMDE